MIVFLFNCRSLSHCCSLPKELYKSVSLRNSNLKFCSYSTKDTHQIPQNPISVPGFLSILIVNVHCAYAEGLQESRNGWTVANDNIMKLGRMTRTTMVDFALTKTSSQFWTNSEKTSGVKSVLSNFAFVILFFINATRETFM